MSDRKMVPGLSHKNMFMEDGEFFSDIDKAGGWPVGYKYVGFEHTDIRGAGFTNSNQNTGWWTIVASADDYYMWKLSPEAMQRIVNAAISASRPSYPKASALFIENSSGRKADLQKPQS